MAETTRTPHGRTIRYAITGAPILDESVMDGTFAPGVGVLPALIELVYSSAHDGHPASITASVVGCWTRFGIVEQPERGTVAHFKDGPVGWPAWLAEEARLHDPAAPVAPASTHTDQAALRDRITKAIHHDLNAHRGRRDQGLLGIVPRLADAVLAVLPAPADRAAILREVADVLPEADLPFVRPMDRSRVANWLRRLADDASGPVRADDKPQQDDIECANCWRLIENRSTPSMGSPAHDNWIHVPGGFTHCVPQRGADSPRAEPKPAAGVQQDDTWPVKDSTRRYAEELRAAPGTASADGHTGWECDAGASLLVAASTPGPGKLGTHHGTIYACATHQGASVERITGAGYVANPAPAPPGHRWNPWPCGHVTAHDTQALATLTAAVSQPDGEA